MSGLVSVLHNRVRRFESARNLSLPPSLPGQTSVAWGFFLPLTIPISLLAGCKCTLFLQKHRHLRIKQRAILIERACCFSRKSVLLPTNKHHIHPVYSTQVRSLLHTSVEETRHKCGVNAAQVWKKRRFSKEKTSF